MKQIILTTAALTNDGVRADGGTTIEVGDAEGAIDAARAKALIESGAAVTVTQARAAERAADKDDGKSDGKSDDKPGA